MLSLRSPSCSRLFAAAVGAVFGIVGSCGVAQAQMKEVTFIVVNNLFSTPAFVAIENGYWEKLGLNVKVKLTASGSQVTKALQAGEAQFGHAALSTTIASARAGGNMLTGVMPYFNAAEYVALGGRAIIGRKDRGIDAANPKSMEGKKITQARDALRFVLDHLNDTDRFNIVTFNTAVTRYADTLRPATDRAAARRFIDDLRAAGGTNIDDALREALSGVGSGTSVQYVLLAIQTARPAAGEDSAGRVSEGRLPRPSASCSPIRAIRTICCCRAVSSAGRSWPGSPLSSTLHSARVTSCFSVSVLSTATSPRGISSSSLTPS